MNKERLNTALSHFSQYGIETPLDEIELIEQAAQAYLDLLSLIEQLKELDEAGKKIRDDEFYCDTGDEVHNDAGCVFAYPKDEMFRDTNFESNSAFMSQAANARSDIEALYAEVLELRERVQDWQPIETAPRDTVVLVNTEQGVLTARLDKDDDLDDWSFVWKNYDDYELCLEAVHTPYSTRYEYEPIEASQPTDWMPLPQPPKTEK